MTLYKIDSAYSVVSIKNHKKIKKDLISLIEKSESQSIKNGIDSINLSDWSISKNPQRDWVNYFLEKCIYQVNSIYLEMGYSVFQIESIWFQRYQKNDHHGWHTHPDTTFSNVYYLELPEESEATQVISPYDKSIIEINATEGDLVTFPAYLNHRAPKNMSNKNRTVIVFNVYASHSTI